MFLEQLPNSLLFLRWCVTNWLASVEPSENQSENHRLMIFFPIVMVGFTYIQSLLDSYQNW